MVVTYGRKQKRRRVTRKINSATPSYSSATRKRKNTTFFEELYERLSSINNRRRNVTKLTTKTKSKSIKASELEGNIISPATSKTTDDVNNVINLKNNRGRPMMRATRDTLKSIGKVARLNKSKMVLILVYHIIQTKMIVIHFLNSIAKIIPPMLLQAIKVRKGRLCIIPNCLV